MAASKIVSSSVSSTSDFKNMVENQPKGGLSVAQQQVKEVLDKIAASRRSDKLNLRIKVTSAANDSKVVIFNPIGLNTTATSASTAPVFTTNVPGGYTNLLKLFYGNYFMAVRGLTIAVSDVAIFERNWWILEGDIGIQSSRELNSDLENAKQTITDDPKTRFLPLDFAIDAGFGLYIDDLDNAEYVNLTFNVVYQNRLR